MEVRTKSLTGDKTHSRIPATANASRMRNPYGSRRMKLAPREGGSRQARILLPSSGGMGSRLKTPSIALMKMPAMAMLMAGYRKYAHEAAPGLRAASASSFRITAKRSMTPKLAIGPARET